MPLAETIETFFDRKAKPHVPDAWIDTTKRDEKDGEVGVVGYETTQPLLLPLHPASPARRIEADVRGIERDIVRMLGEITGSAVV